MELYLIGNKSDLVERRAIPAADIEEYCRKKKMSHFESSAKDDEKVTDIFIDFARKMMKKTEVKQQAARKEDKSPNTTLSSKTDKQEKKSCCWWYVYALPLAIQLAYLDEETSHFHKGDFPANGLIRNDIWI